MIIGIVGKARSGKNTLADYLVDIFYTRFGRKFESLAFADELKLLCKIHFNLTYEQLYGLDKEVEDIRFIKDDGTYWTAREIMQAIGEFYRSIDKDYWIKSLDATINKHGYKDVIITDIRYRNELEYIKKNNGLIIKVFRDNRELIHGAEHKSETDLDGLEIYDFYVDNNGSLNELYKTALEIVDNINFKNLEVVNGS